MQCTLTRGSHPAHLAGTQSRNQRIPNSNGPKTHFMSFNLSSAGFTGAQSKRDKSIQHMCVCVLVCVFIYLFKDVFKILLKHHLFISHSMSLENTAAPSRKFTSSHSPKFGSLLKLGYKRLPKNWTTTKHQWSFKTLRKLMVV